MFEQISASIQRARDSAHRRVNSFKNRDAADGGALAFASRGLNLDAANHTTDVPEASSSATTVRHAGLPAYCYDVAIRFIGASGLPGLDINGQSDPYIVANLDERIEFKSSVRQTTLTPIWNEHWYIQNVPETAVLHVRVFDKDDKARDDFIGEFKTSLREGAQECRLDSEQGAQRGTLWFEVKLTPSHTPNCPQYSFDGPVSFSRHISASIGRFAGTKGSGLEDKAAFFAAALPVTTAPEPSPLPSGTPPKQMSSTDRLRKHSYSTWKIHLKGVSRFFEDKQQHWLESYPAAQKIFTGPVLLRTSIKTAHRLLYARTSLNEFGIITSADDLWRELAPQERSSTKGATARNSSPPRNAGSPGRAKKNWIVKPVLYTYIIGMDDRLRFSETGAAFFTDFASKHALHACVNEHVRYAGEFHARPLVEGGWAGLEGKLPPEGCEWELWIDNASGTYGPDPALLPKLKETLEYNFPGLKVEAFDYKNEELAKSKADMLAYAKSKPSLSRTPSDVTEAVEQLSLEEDAAPVPPTTESPRALPRELIMG